MAIAILTQGTEKQCTKCRGMKPLAEFYLHKKHGTQYWCRDCAKECARDWRLAHPERARANGRAHYHGNKDQYREAKRRFYIRHPEKPRQYQLKRQYGLSLDDFAALLSAQGNRCAICRTDDAGGRGDWHVDHDHETERVRGLLCHRCNVALIDDASILRRMLTYLEES
jgi:Autographiviridae endonuclease VII